MLRLYRITTRHISKSHKQPRAVQNGAKAIDLKTAIELVFHVTDSCVSCVSRVSFQRIAGGLLDHVGASVEKRTRRSVRSVTSQDQRSNRRVQHRNFEKTCRADVFEH